MASLQSAGHTVVNIDHAAPVCGPLAVIADGLSLPFAEGSARGAILKDVLEHVNDPVAVMREVGRVTGPGAVVVITVPRAVPRAVWDDPTHVRGFTARGLVTLLELAGFDALHRPHRYGGFPGAERLGLTRQLERIMRIPLWGHYFGKNWIIRARLRD